MISDDDVCAGDTYLFGFTSVRQSGKTLVYPKCRYGRACVVLACTEVLGKEFLIVAGHGAQLLFEKYSENEVRGIWGSSAFAKSPSLKLTVQCLA
jgi:hypothetical protein